MHEEHAFSDLFLIFCWPVERDSYSGRMLFLAVVEVVFFTGVAGSVVTNRGELVLKEELTSEPSRRQFIPPSGRVACAAENPEQLRLS